MPTKRLAHHNLVASFPTLAEAERALEVLTDAGVPADELSLLSREWEKRPGQNDISQSQGSGMGGAASAATIGLGAGGVAGGAAAAALGAAAVTVIPGIGLAVGAAALYSAVAGGAVGSIAGGLIAAEAGARKTMMWEQSLQPMISLVEEGYVIVGVHSDDVARVEDAAQRLEDLEPEVLERLDADETYHPPGTVDALMGQDIPSTHAQNPGADMGRDVEEGEDPAVGMKERGSGPTRGEQPAPGGEEGGESATNGSDLDVSDADEKPDQARPR